MKYRVKYKCYWYNTGMGDNHYYIEHEDFDTLEEAESFKKRVDEQFEMSQKWDWNEINWSTYSNWQKSFNSIEVENGFIDGYGEIVKFYPEREEKLN